MAWLPTYPIDDDVDKALAGAPNIAKALAAQGTLSGAATSQEIVRVLGQAGRGHKGSLGIVSSCEAVQSRAPAIGNRVLSANLWFFFLQALTEVYAFEFFDRLDGFDVAAHDPGPRAKGHDLDVRWSGGHLKVEINTPAYVNGYQTLQRALTHVLTYLDSPSGYYIVAKVGPKPEGDIPQHDMYWPECVKTSDELRDWMARIGEQTGEWLRAGATHTISIEGPHDLVLTCNLERWQEDRQVVLRPAGHSTDLYRTWREAPSKSIAKGPFGTDFGHKLNLAQAGPSEAGVLRTFVLDLSLSDASKPGYFLGEPFTTKLGEVVGEIIDLATPPYDLIFPSMLHHNGDANIGINGTVLDNARRDEIERLLVAMDAAVDSNAGN